MMSGTTSKWSTPNQRPVRPNPQTTSSAMSRTPYRSQVRRTFASQPGGGTMQPADDMIGSTMTQDTSSGSLPRIACSIVVAQASSQAGYARPSSQRWQYGGIALV